MKSLATPRDGLRRQKGAALLLMMTTLAVGSAFLLLRALNSSNGSVQRNVEDYKVLSEAKEALINYALLPAGTGLGQLPYPDILDTIDEGTSTNFDGLEDRHCPDTSSSIRPALNVSSRCFGRLPWKSLNMAVDAANQNDPGGIMPWYAVSANLLDACTVNLLNPLFLNRSYWVTTYNCLTFDLLPHPWLTVRDYRGNIISNRVAFVLILPGQRINTQVRPQALSLPRNFLDAVTISSGCTQRCVPGTYDNASYSPGNDFIVGEDRANVSGSNTNYVHPYVFNDKVIYVTIDELMVAMERRAMREAKAKLLDFHSTKHYFPYAANFGNLTGDCVANNQRGLLPRAVGTCDAGDFLSTLPTWFTGANWHHFIYYSSTCTKSVPGICVGAITAGAQQNIKTLIIGTGRPIAPVTRAAQIPAMTTPPYAASAARVQTGFAGTSALDYLDSLENSNGDHVYDALGSAPNAIYNDQIMVVAP